MGKRETRMRQLKIEKGESVIPKGDYCYDKNGCCPYWEMKYEEIEKIYDERGNRFVIVEENGEFGYCHFLEEKDCILLWDQCKICGINEYSEEEIRSMM